MTTLTSPSPQTDARASGALLGHLFDEHGRMVLGVCRIFLHDEYEAEDAAQETFVSAHRSLLSGRHPDDAGPWLAAIARNECRDRIRMSARRNTSAVPSETFDRMPAAAGSAVADDIDRGASLQQGLAELPETQREAFVLREMLGLRYDEIAKALDTTESAVESLLVRARRGLKSHLRPMHLAPAVLVVPFALRESIAYAVVGFPAGTAATGATATTSALATATQTASTGSSASASGSAGVGSASGAPATAGTATSTSVGTSAVAGVTATGTGTSMAAAAGVPALAGMAKIIATPILAKLAIAGAAATVVATMAVSKPWTVENRQAEAPPAADVSEAGNDRKSGVAAAQAELATSPQGAARGGGSKSVANGNKSTKRKSKQQSAAPKPAATVAVVDGGDQPAEPPAAPPSQDPTGEAPASATETPNSENNNGKPAQSNGKKRGHEEDGPGNSNNAKGKSKSKTVGDKGKSEQSNGKKRGHEEDGPGNSNNAKGKSKSKAAADAATPEEAPAEPAADSGATTDSEKKPEKKNGRKRGHEEDGPGNSNESNGKSKHKPADESDAVSDDATASDADGE